ncbi:hypothetical protein [Microbacterium sp. BH-3-3-3]|uniref:hypothetical protein n=1 Tax=Microbacterium sp. BH-3-3-3 TaxID=1906742 RepID=UPI0011A25AE5|nr:hypothetical protein [Microbacterium sp. BH-3-3-3]
MSNALVAGPIDTATPFSGAGLLDSGTQLASAIESGNWVEGGLAAFSTVVDTVATAIDPLGSLIAAGLGWLIDHFEPIKGWFNDLTGDAGAVAGFSQTWTNVQNQLNSSADYLDRVVTDLDDMAGEAIDAYRRFQTDAAAHIRASGQWAGAMATGLQIASTIVQVVHDLVRDILSQLVGSAISWATEAVVTVGIATPWIISQVSTRVASWTAKISGKLTGLLRSCGKLGDLLSELRALMSRGASLLEKVPRRGARNAGSSTSARPHSDPPVYKMPDPSDVTVESIDLDLVDHGLVSRFDATTPPDGATFWSGRVIGPDGKEVPGASMNSAADLASSTHGSSLEQLLERQGLTDDMPSDWLDPSTAATWRSVSKNLAESASGDVRAVLGDVKQTSVWNEIEFPTLVQNPNVRSITIHDAVTQEVMHVFHR